jgi:hypothetical protein
MKGYIARKGNRWYAVIYEGTDPITGRERRSWHPAGCERADAERLAARLASERDGAGDGARSLSFGAFLNSRWLPGKRLVLAASTYNGYRRNVEGHVVPALGRIGLRRLRPHHLEAFYDGLLHPRDGRAALAPKTVYEILRGVTIQFTPLSCRFVVPAVCRPGRRGCRRADHCRPPAAISQNHP